jgi:hypothetical protein
MLTWKLSNIEQTPCVVTSGDGVTGPSYFAALPVEDGLEVICGGNDYAGVLARFTNPLVHPPSKLVATWDARFSSPLSAYGNVVGMSTLITDADGYTYPGYFQVVPANSWVTQIGDADGRWTDQGVLRLQPDVWNTVAVNYDLNYVKRQVFINNSVGLDAKKLGFAAGTITTQFQLCTNAKARAAGAGFYSVRVKDVTLEAVA